MKILTHTGDCSSHSKQKFNSSRATSTVPNPVDKNTLKKTVLTKIYGVKLNKSTYFIISIISIKRNRRSITIYSHSIFDS